MENPLLLQLNQAVVDKNPSVYDNGYVHVDLCLTEHDHEMIQLIEEEVLRKLSCKYQEQCKNASKTSSILRTRNYSYHSIHSYDDHGNEIQVNEHVTARDRVSVIVQLDKFVSTPFGSYFQYTIAQLKKHSVCKLPKQAIKDTVSAVDLTKYQQMLKVGIPMDAIRHKMKLDGIPDEMCLQLKITPPTSTIPPPPPPPPPPIKLFSGGGNPMAALLADIKGGTFALKKAGDVAVRPKKEKVLKFVDTSKKVPSLDEIQSALKNLRRLSKADVREDS